MPSRKWSQPLPHKFYSFTKTQSPGNHLVHSILFGRRSTVGIALYDSHNIVILVENEFPDQPLQRQLATHHHPNHLGRILTLLAIVQYTRTPFNRDKTRPTSLNEPTRLEKTVFARSAKGCTSST